MYPYPRPVRDVHQIELSTRCNLRCHYCPSPHLPRPKMDMEWGTYEASLDLVHYYIAQGTQTELSLTGIGEAMLHPRFIEAVELARLVLGPDRRLTITTNGLLLTEDLCRALQPLKPWVFVSLHRPEKAGPAIELAKKYGILAGYNAAFATAAFDWAGALKGQWFVSAPPLPCEYLRSGWVVVLVDGRVATCCLDTDGSSAVGTVWDDPDTLQLQPWGTEEKGCKACHMTTDF